MGLGKLTMKSVLRQDLKGDYKATLSQLDSIRQNLATTARGATQGLTQDQNRQLGGIQRLLQRGGAQSSRAMVGATASMRNRYGTALGGVTQPLLDPARATKKAAALGEASAAKGAGQLTAGGMLALKVEKQGAKTAAASAEYGAAVADKYRAQQDAQTVLQYQQQQAQIRLQKAQLAFEREKAGLTAKGGAQFGVLTANAPTDAYLADNILTNGVTITAADGTTTTLDSSSSAGQIANYIVGQNAVTDPNEIQYIGQVVKNMKGGMNATDASTAAASTLFSEGFKNFDPAAFNSAVASGLESQQASAVSSAISGVQASPENQVAVIAQLKARGFSVAQIQSFIGPYGFQYSDAQIAAINASTISPPGRPPVTSSTTVAQYFR